MTKKRIVVIDDDPEKEAICAFLPEHDIIFEQDAKQALKIIESEKPDLIILDYNMPDLTGFEIAQKVRQTPLISSTPIIFATAVKDESIEENAYRMFGALEWLIKPLNLRILTLTVEQHFKLADQKASQNNSSTNETLLAIGFEGDPIVESITVPTEVTPESTDAVTQSLQQQPSGVLVTPNISQHLMEELVTECSTHAIPIIGIVAPRKMGSTEGKIESLLKSGATSTVMKNAPLSLINAKLKALSRIDR